MLSAGSNNVIAAGCRCVGIAAEPGQTFVCTTVSVDSIDSREQHSAASRAFFRCPLVWCRQRLHMDQRARSQSDPLMLAVPGQLWDGGVVLALLDIARAHDFSPSRTGTARGG